MSDDVINNKKVPCKNLVTSFSIRMYINGFIIGYVFRDDIHKKFYLHKNDNIIFSKIKQILSIQGNTHYSINEKVSQCKNVQDGLFYNNRNVTHSNNSIIKKIKKLKSNIQVSNYLAIRLTLWTSICSLCYCELNKKIENNAIVPLISGGLASSISKFFFQEKKRVLIPAWMGCALGYIIFF